MPNVDVEGELVTSVTFDKHSLALDMFFFVISVFCFHCVFRMIPASNRYHHLPHLNQRFTAMPFFGAGEDAFKAVGIAAVMEKAGCPIPPDLQELVERFLGKPYGLHQVLTGLYKPSRTNFAEVVGL